MPAGNKIGTLEINFFQGIYTKDLQMVGKMSIFVELRIGYR